MKVSYVPNSGNQEAFALSFLINPAILASFRLFPHEVSGAYDPLCGLGPIMR